MTEKIISSPEMTLIDRFSINDLVECQVALGIKFQKFKVTGFKFTSQGKERDSTTPDILVGVDEDGNSVNYPVEFCHLATSPSSNVDDNIEESKDEVEEKVEITLAPRPRYKDCQINYPNIFPSTAQLEIVKLNTILSHIELIKYSNPAFDWQNVHNELEIQHPGKSAELIRLLDTYPQFKFANRRAAWDIIMSCHPDKNFFVNEASNNLEANSYKNYLGVIVSLGNDYLKKYYYLANIYNFVKNGNFRDEYL